MGRSSIVKDGAILAVAVAAAVVTGKGFLALNAQRAPAASPAPVAMASLAPPSGHPAPAEVAKGADGHYWAEASVGGRHVRFLVDTGASAVALTAEDARRLGFDLTRLEFDRDVTTAAGAGKAAVVELPYVSVAGARVDKVPALVIREGLETSLLGMTYLGRLDRFEATQRALILRP
jgi:aspartyl protease family protein